MNEHYFFLAFFKICGSRAIFSVFYVNVCKNFSIFVKFTYFLPRI